MKTFKSLSLAAAVAVIGFTAAAPEAQAQIEPMCPYGYYDYAPYACAPYGYYGPEWFTGGVFLGAGPWSHGHEGFAALRTIASTRVAATGATTRAQWKTMDAVSKAVTKAVSEAVTKAVSKAVTKAAAEAATGAEAAATAKGEIPWQRNIGSP